VDVSFDRVADFEKDEGVDTPIVRQFWSMQAKVSASPSHSKSATPKTTPKPSRKFYRLASQITPRTVKLAGPSEQQLILVEEIVSSPESSRARDNGNTPVEQGSPRVSPTQTPTKGKGTALAELSTKQTPPTKKTPSKKTVSKRKASPKQGLAEGEFVEPSSKKARKATPTTSKLAQLLQRRVVRGKIVNVAYF